MARRCSRYSLPAAKAHSRSCAPAKLRSHAVASASSSKSCRSLRHNCAARSALSSTSCVPPSGCQAIAMSLSPSARSGSCSSARQAEAIGRDQARDHRLAEAEGALDHAFVGAAQRVAREQDAGALRRHQRLQHHGHARLRRDAEAPSVGERRGAARRLVHAGDRAEQALARAHVEHALVLSGKAGLRAVFSQRRGAHRGGAERVEHGAHALSSGRIAEHHALHESRGQGPARWHRQTLAQRSTELARLAAILFAVDRVKL